MSSLSVSNIYNPFWYQRQVQCFLRHTNIDSVVLFSILKDFIALPTLKSHRNHNSSLTLAGKSFFLSRNSLDCSQLDFSFKYC